jgi:hypothetical protein
LSDLVVKIATVLFSAFPELKWGHLGYTANGSSFVIGDVIPFSSI